MNASCLLLTILAANHAAARPDTSLPYLAQTAPEALRFAVRRPLGPPPVRPGTLSEKTADAHESAPAPEIAADAHAAAGHASAPDNVAAHPAPAHVGTQPVTTPPPAGAALVPDTYAPAPPPVTIEDLLPFFIPPAAPTSRATYELK